MIKMTKKNLKEMAELCVVAAPCGCLFTLQPVVNNYSFCADVNKCEGHVFDGLDDAELNSMRAAVRVGYAMASMAHKQRQLDARNLRDKRRPSVRASRRGERRA